jgi:anti-sigma factor RsiW
VIWRRRRPGLACSELVELVTDYLDDALSKRDRTRFEEHIAGCDDCTAYVAQFRQTIAALEVLPPEEPEPATVDALLQVFRGWSEDRPGGAGGSGGSAGPGGPAGSPG